MTGVEHLERMGRELKCPICLNLLHTAASLSCNHVFCSLCISKSMKSASACPVCKVPFHRRDIRPSPHMDSLVTIYKSMEAEAGVNLFVSQGEPGNGASDDHESPLPRGKMEFSGGKGTKRKAPEIQSKYGSFVEAAAMDLHPQVPSFPSKKRVHVTPYSVSETPPRPENLKDAAKEKALVDHKGDLLFSPFFWMREDVDEDEDQGSERTTPQQSGGTPPPAAPCFSDIKDEDDAGPTAKTPTSKSRDGELLDSEMFEWTQRPCSPELWLTPAKDQTRETSRSDECSEEKTADQSPRLTARGKRKLIWKRARRSGAAESADARKGRRNRVNLEKAERKRKQTATPRSSGESVADKHPAIPQDAAVKCSFCHSSEETEASGEMKNYLHGARNISSHKLCAEWAPNVFFDGDVAVNLAAEVARSKRIKCSRCGLKGAALGCLERSCRKSFHYTCAKLLSGCRWDPVNFVMLCPLHASSRLPIDAPESQRLVPPKSGEKSAPRSQSSMRQPRRWPTASSPKWVLCCSSLSTAEKEAVSELAKLAGVSLSKRWSPAVTHVIASVNEQGACKRTLKSLMAIAGGKWILNMDWVNACLKKKEPVEEPPYEIREDVHGMRDGPRLGRLRSLRKEPKLFEGYEFYFTGDLSAAYRGYLRDLIAAAGGAILQRRPICKQGGASSPVPVYIVYSLELVDGSAEAASPPLVELRRVEAAALAEATGGRAVTNRWILDSIAGCRVVDAD